MLLVRFEHKIFQSQIKFSFWFKMGLVSVELVPNSDKVSMRLALNVTGPQGDWYLKGLVQDRQKCLYYVIYVIACSIRN